MVVTGEAGNLTGIISERDIINHISRDGFNPHERMVRDIMVTDVIACPLGTPIAKIRGAMTTHGIRHIPVTEDGFAVGMISTKEVMAHQHAKAELARDVTIYALAKVAEARDSDTGRHIERVACYVQVVAEELLSRGKFADEVDEDFVRLIHATSPLHDVGKITIPDCVLLKPARLDDWEFELMKTHTSAGARTLGLPLKQYPEADFLNMAKDIAEFHHEKIDGSGYPTGLTGDDIPLSARVFAPIDVYDALVSKRVYKEAFTHDIAVSIIREGRGVQFDGDVIDAFLACHQKLLAIKKGFDMREAA